MRKQYGRMAMLLMCLFSVEAYGESYVLLAKSAIVSSGAPRLVDPRAPGLPRLFELGRAGGQVLFVVPDKVPAGRYFLGVRITVGSRSNDDYLLNMQGICRIVVRHNGRLIRFSEATDPARHPGRKLFMAEVRPAESLEISPGDEIRVHTQWNDAFLEWIILHTKRPTDSVQPVARPQVFLAEQEWLKTVCAAGREGDTVKLSFSAENVSGENVSAGYIAELRDYFMVLLERKEGKFSLAPRAKASAKTSFRVGTSPQYRWLITFRDDRGRTARAVKYVLADVPRGVRTLRHLRSGWRFAEAPGCKVGSAPPADARWRDISVPAYIDFKDFHIGWYRLSLGPIRKEPGRRCRLWFGRVMQEPFVYINGKLVYHHTDGFHPFEADITDALNSSGDNKLTVGVLDYLAAIPVEDRKKLAGKPFNWYKTNLLKIRPVTKPKRFGISDEVRLLSMPSVHIADIFPQPSVRRQKLAATVTVRNDSHRDREVKVAGVVLDVGQPVLNLSATSVKVPAGKSVQVTVEAPWKERCLLGGGRL